MSTPTKDPKTLLVAILAHTPEPTEDQQAEMLRLLDALLAEKDKAKTAELAAFSAVDEVTEKDNCTQKELAAAKAVHAQCQRVRRELEDAVVKLDKEVEMVTVAEALKRRSTKSDELELLALTKFAEEFSMYL